ncbi:HAMP domain-containing sensor histidine kinase [Galbibacter sp. EGI 63066]|uniref:sensor histidine kinase n=1 Tax=Galbibacter sp. EGI 63066 TaxID=2993559 RepID=UPI0022491CC7|nr:HAMP domain-containing sensor histidine kinase [Galbibacter sp. EGI 63066]MCX2679898.1 HAMP domain-containing sensor histidine kinase [Galbibacter sp. EGI 63066]
MLNFKKGYVVVFIISVIGLAFIQYQYLKIGLNLAKVQFNNKTGQALQTIKTDLGTKNELTFLMVQAINEDDSHFTLSVDSIQDASRYFLNDFLIDRLLQRGIKTEFVYRLHTNDSTIFLSPGYKTLEEEELKFPVLLSGYLPEAVNKRLVLEIQFEDLNNYFLSQLNGLTIPSLIFIAAIIVVVIWVLRSMYWQKNVIATTNDFINNLTHELKTPVFSIGLATKLLEEKVDEESKSLVGIVREQNERLKVHIDKVLELSGIENKKSVLRLKKQDFYPSLKKLAESFSELSVMEDVDFNYELKGETYWLNCEQNHLANAVGNLLDNAKKYSGSHPVIQLNAYVEEKILYIVVEDNGIGIEKSELKNIFKKFHRIPSGDLHNVRGYGLGLSYVKQVIKLHKGSVSVESDRGKGTKVTIKLPVVEDDKK